MEIRQLAKETESYVIEQRRWFHRHPELSWEEWKTTDAIAAELEKMGLTVKRYEGLPGCSALICGGKAKPGCKTVALRADIDALPVQEKTGLPFASVNPNCMHACGHDTHIAMLLGGAKILTQLQDQLEGNVLVFFQAAEESCYGAREYLKQGALDGVDAIYGQHVWDGLEAPYMNIQAGPRMASSDNFTITVEGVSCHGSNPSGGTDAIVAASAIVMNLQTIVSRNNDPLNPLVVTVGEIHGGQRFNIIANKVVMEGTCRTHSQEMRDRIEPLLRRIAEDTASAFGARAELRYGVFHGPLINDHPDLNEIAGNAALKLFGKEGVKELPKMMSGEDFSYFMEKVPGVYGYLGSHDAVHCYGNHNDRYDVDESILWRGAAMHAQFAFDYLSTRNGDGSFFS